MSSSHLLPLVALLALTPVVAAATSLWTAPGSRERGLATDATARQPGDILTIVIAESAASSSAQNKKTNSTSSVNAGVEQFLFPSSGFGKHKGELPGLRLGGSSGYTAGGEVSQTQSLSGRAAVLVTDVLPNGNLVVAGARQLVFAGETQNVILHGLVRPADISAGNTVLSTNIAEARVEFIASGDLERNQRRGWFSRILEAVKPF